MKQRGPLGELVRRARRQARQSQYELARKLGCTDSYVAKIETGRAYPATDFLVRLFAELKIDERQLVKVALPRALKPILEKVMRGVRRGEPAVRPLPIFGEIVAGSPVEARRAALGELEVLPETWSLSRYALKVSGDSMSPTIQPGDLVLVDTSLRPRQNDIVACVLNGEATLKRYIKRGTIILLKADNPAFSDIIPVTSTDDFRVEGVILKIIERNLRSPA
ncbi:MAG: helix-turn-helix domain-containing protein [Terriglobia bacterium]